MKKGDWLFFIHLECIDLQSYERLFQIKDIKILSNNENLVIIDSSSVFMDDLILQERDNYTLATKLHKILWGVQ